MKLHKNLLVAAASAVAISALPFNLESIASGSVELSSAYAKGGNGGGNGGGHGGGHSSHGGSGAHGKSADARGHGKSGDVRTGARHDKLLAAIGKETKAEKRRSRIDDVKTAKAAAKSLREEQVAIPDTVTLPTAKPEDRNLHARLAGLNSLQRNYHAYLNSQSPRMAGIAAFVMASAQLALAQTPSEELLAATDDEALKQALLDAANKNRVAQYGDDYVNDDVMDWAKDVLGVGDAFGKIDEVQETLEVDSQ